MVILDRISLHRCTSNFPVSLEKIPCTRKVINAILTSCEEYRRELKERDDMGEQKEYSRRLLEDVEKMQKLSAILKENGIQVFEYFIEEDKLVVYEDLQEGGREIQGYLAYLETKTKIHPEDRWKAIEFYHGRMEGPIELRKIEIDGSIGRKMNNASLLGTRKQEGNIFWARQRMFPVTDAEKRFWKSRPREIC